MPFSSGLARVGQAAKPPRWLTNANGRAGPRRVFRLLSEFFRRGRAASIVRYSQKGGRNRVFYGKTDRVLQAAEQCRAKVPGRRKRPRPKIAASCFRKTTCDAGILSPTRRGLGTRKQFARLEKPARSRRRVKRGPQPVSRRRRPNRAAYSFRGARNPRWCDRKNGTVQTAVGCRAAAGVYSSAMNG